ncbi:putative protein BCP1 [Blattamonas nauphoetae]|uniref:Protein BCP1 n=1 Tax=Blattamonas nauphoetae TaxID=2049346 RepID=A0ABQ9XYW7_9EUKA|nr:putative protein BCP1 [Blattamonas nauphoetae]
MSDSEPISKQKRTRSSKSEDHDSSPELDSDQEEGTVNVNFDVFHPVEEDAHDISGLLMHFVDDHPFHSMDIADLIISQARNGEGIGSVVSTNEGEDVVGVSSIIDLQFSAANQGVTDILHYVRTIVTNAEKSTEPSLTQANNIDLFKQCLDGHHPTSLVLFERMINIIPQLSPHIYRSLISELHNSIEESDPKKNPRFVPPPQFRSTHYLILSRIIIEESDIASNKSQPSKRKHKKKEKVKEKEIDINQAIFPHPEDEIFMKNQSASFLFPIVADRFGEEDTGLSQRGIAILLTRENFERSSQELFDFYGIPDAELPKKPD